MQVGTKQKIKLTFTLFVISITYFSGSFLDAHADHNGKTTVCHSTGGTFSTLHVEETPLQTHLEHGDQLGSCDGDADSDGYTIAGGDCNDSDSGINPGALEIPNDGIDQNCDGSDSADTTPPVITLLGPNPQTIELGSGYTELGATTDDGSPVTIDSSLFVDAVGSYTISYDSTDGTNNATTVTRTVNVVDTTAPVISLTGDNPQTIELGLGYTELGATTDDGSPVTIDSSLFVDAVGSYTISYDSTDGINNATTVTRTVNVVDTTAIDADNDGVFTPTDFDDNDPCNPNPEHELCLEHNYTEGGGTEWDTRPTFGQSHQIHDQTIVENGFGLNGKSFPILDNHHSQFKEQIMAIGQKNSFEAKVYAVNNLQVQEFLFGIPNVGEAHLAELGVEIWYDKDGEIKNINTVQKSNVVDKESIIAIHEKTKCQFSDIEEKCDSTNISMIFREPLRYEVMAIKAIDYKNRYQITYLNDGIDISGSSLNPMDTKMIPSTVKGEGLIKVTQTEKYSPYWVTEDGRMFEKNESDSFKQLNITFDRIQDSGTAYTREHSEFGRVIAYEQKRAVNVFDSSEFISELPEIFAYSFPESEERITEETIQEMKIQEHIAQKVLEEMNKQHRWN